MQLLAGRCFIVSWIVCFCHKFKDKYKSFFLEYIINNLLSLWGMGMRIQLSCQTIKLCVHLVIIKYEISYCYRVLSDCVPDCGNLIFYCLPRQVGLFTLPLCALIALCRFHLACLSLCGTNLSPSLVSAISSSYYPLSSVFSTPFHRSLYLVVCYFICWFLLWVSRS